MEGWISSARSTVEAGGQGDEGEPWWLPPGFRFHPTDEELVAFYLANKIYDAKFTHRAITEADLNTCEPWELPGKAQMGETEWYFYSLRDRKYPSGTRTNRATQAGYWKATGKDRAVVSSRSGKLVGMKKTLVFYSGRAPNGLKSNWVMHEYRTAHFISPATAPPFKSRTTPPAQDEWAVCRVFYKTAGGKKVPLADIHQSNAHMRLAAATTQTAPITLPALMELPLAPSSLPSAHFSGHAQPGTIHLANLLHSLPPATNNFTSATPDNKLDNSVVEALFQNYGSDLRHDTSFYDKIKPDPVSYSIPTISSSANITVDISSSSCSSAARILELPEAPRFKYTSLPLFQLPSARHINLQGQHGPTIVRNFNADNAAAAPILSPEALSDTCSTEHASPPHVFPLPSDLEGLCWLYAGHHHQPV